MTAANPRVNQTLNFVVTVFRDDGPNLYVHQMPLPRAVFETYALVMAQAFSTIQSKGIGIVSAPRVAVAVLKDAATKAGCWETDAETGAPGVKDGLLTEMRRLSSACIFTPDNGWRTLPLVEAIKGGLVTPEEVDEVDQLMAFFIVASAMYRRHEIKGVLAFVAKMWDAQLTYSTPTEFSNSLPTSTPAETTAGTPQA